MWINEKKKENLNDIVNPLVFILLMILIPFIIILAFISFCFEKLPGKKEKSEKINDKYKHSNT